MNTQTSTGEWLTIDEAVEATTRTKKAIMGWVYKHKVNAKKMADETWLIDEDSLLERHNATEQRSVAGQEEHYEYVTVKQACEMTNRTKKAIMRWVYNKDVVSFKTQHGWMIQQKSLWQKDATTGRRVCKKRRTNAEILADKLHQQKLNALDKPKPEIDFENFFRHALVLEMLRVSASLHMVQQIAEHVGNPEGCSAIIIDFLKEMDLWVRQLQGQTYPFGGE